MSTFMYAQIAQVKQSTARNARTAARAKASGNYELLADTKTESEADAASQQTIGRYVEALAGLIPAEVLALHAMILSATTKIDNPGKNTTEVATTTTISAPQTLCMAFWGLVILSLLLYVVPRGIALWKEIEKPRSLKRWLLKLSVVEGMRAAIPPLSFVAWTMLQRATAFDAAFADVTEANRTVAGLFLAVVLLAVSAWVAFKPNPGSANGDDADDTDRQGDLPPPPAPAH